ncbi:TRAP transporter small permease [Uliginosibacterium sp. 31-16]|uniref:TRAP transporter small permease n=1 Tax=Uliginosibacterium sp. 31-16 TaxID=3068315 RepID=UPI00273E004E|nr:TRAP transporter small permease [Uliginosibacterium sp. 31-16]MDP5238849.1 TRAP transporter small permease [Uliginosibacterium sp. 31-16]
MEFLFKIKGALDRVLQTALILAFASLSICVIWGVVTRYALNDPAIFTEEVSRFSVIWLSLLGTAYACGRLEHMAYTMFEDKLSPAHLRQHMRAVAAIVLAFGAVVLVYGGGKLVLRALQVEQLSATLEIPMGYIYACIPISGIAVVFYQILILLAPERFKAFDEVDEAIDHIEQELGS